jgi:hypothetical protein
LGLGADLASCAGEGGLLGEALAKGQRNSSAATLSAVLFLTGIVHCSNMGRIPPAATYGKGVTFRKRPPWGQIFRPPGLPICALHRTLKL